MPDSSHSLLSVPSLTYYGYHYEITNSGSWIWDKRGHMVIQANALSPANNLHWFQLEMIIPMTGIVASLVDDHSYYIWHQCFGHTSWNALHHVSTHLSGVASLNLPADLAPCKGYQIRKMPDCTFPAFDKWVSCPLTLVQIDLIGPMPTKPCSCARYILTFIDDCTEYALLSFLQAKLDCLPNFIICSLGLRPLLLTLLPPCIWTKEVNL